MKKIKRKTIKKHMRSNNGFKVGYTKEQLKRNILAYTAKPLSEKELEKMRRKHELICWIIVIIGSTVIGSLLGLFLIVLSYA